VASGWFAKLCPDGCGGQSKIYQYGIAIVIIVALLLLIVIIVKYFSANTPQNKDN